MANFVVKEDRYRAMEHVIKIGGLDNHLQITVVFGDPISKCRPRFSRSGRPYTPKKTVEGEKRIAGCFYGIKRFEGNVAVACLFYRSNFQRIDIDNCMKAVLDAGTRANLWHDDTQVTALLGIMEHDKNNPRTVIAIAPHESTLKRGENALETCEACGKRFKASGHRRRAVARWCSRECRTYLATLIKCRVCGKMFKRKSGNQKLCSRECQVREMAERNKRISQALTHCPQGHPYDEANTHILKNGARRCRKCQAAAARRARNKRGQFLKDEG